MSMYNLIAGGQNPFIAILMMMLGFKTSSDVPRLRDAWLTEDSIVVFARIGGGNRADYEDEIEKLRAMDGYVSDKDNEYDATYAEFTFKHPEEYAAEIKIMMDQKVHELPTANDYFKELMGQAG